MESEQDLILDKLYELARELDDPNDWKAKCAVFAEILLNSEGRPREEIEQEWKQIASNNPFDNREALRYKDGSALEALRDFIVLDNTFPPPELLFVIVGQYEKYMNANGVITLEEAFFGSAKGAGVYSKRRSQEEENQTLFFFFSVEIGRNQRLQTGKNFSEILEEAFLTPIYKEPQEDKAPLEFNPLYNWGNRPERTEEDIDNFLRNFRRWRKREGSVWVSYDPSKDLSRLD